jgi:2-dehydropantoate 2-reductase
MAGMRILVVGAGVIGSVYAGKLLQAGHEVVLLARGARLQDLRGQGLVLEEAETGQRTVLPVPAVASARPDDPYDLVLVPVRRDQMTGVLPGLADLDGGPDVLFFGNAAGRVGELRQALGQRAVFGFPAAGGTRDGAVIRYVLIRQQKTMVGEPGGATTARIRRLSSMFGEAGLPTKVSHDVEGWLAGHAAFVVPIAFALYRVGTDAARLAADGGNLRLMVRATRQALGALRAAGNAEIPGNLKVLYLLMPEMFAVRYWRRVLSSPRGELWFAAHSRAAPEEMTSLAGELLATVHRTGRAAPDLDALLGSR